MAAKRRKKELVEPLIVAVGQYGEFEVTYRRVPGDEGPVAEFFGFVDGKRVNILRFADFKYDTHYRYNPDTPQDRKFSLDPVVVHNRHDELIYIMDALTDMVQAAGYKGLATSMRRDQNLDVSIAVKSTFDVMKALRRQEKRKAKMAK